MKKVYFVAMAGPGSLEDLKELIEPIKEIFDGLVITYHGQIGDDESIYLESVKKCGKIVYLPFSRRHDFSRNAYLYCGPLKNGDICVQCDILERINAETLKVNLPQFIEQSEINGNNHTFYYYGKPLVFSYHESMVYKGNPHEGLIRQDGRGKGMDITNMFPVESDLRWNVRPIKRPNKYHFVKHYCAYSLYPWGSNHYMLGLEGKPNAAAIYYQRDNARLDFIEHLESIGIDRNVDAVIQHMKGDMPEASKRHIRTDKIWNDCYRLYVLGREDFSDNHDWSNLVEVP